MGVPSPRLNVGLKPGHPLTVLSIPMFTLGHSLGLGDRVQGMLRFPIDDGLTRRAVGDDIPATLEQRGR
eukprot:3077868-Pyramimonas_sp.AAC.1